LASTPQSLTLVGEAESLGHAREFVRKGALDANLPESRMRELDLLIEEILVNIWRYAFPEDAEGTVTVTYSIPGPGQLAVEVSDQGVEFDPLKVNPPDMTLGLAQRPVGGLGIWLVKSFARSLTYRREQGWNRLTFAVSANR
jgi:serine/threonine-protein kinase RsbW